MYKHTKKHNHTQRNDHIHTLTQIETKRHTGHQKWKQQKPSQQNTYKNTQNIAYTTKKWKTKQKVRDETFSDRF